MSNKSWSKLPSRGGNGCRGMEEPKWHFGICYSTFNRLRTLTCHPSSSWASEVKGERQHAVGHCFCLPHYSLRGTRANQHPAKCSVIGCVYSVLAWFHAWLDCRIPFEENGLPLFVHEIVCTWVGQICIFRAVCICVGLEWSAIKGVRWGSIKVLFVIMVVFPHNQIWKQDTDFRISFSFTLLVTIYT